MNGKCPRFALSISFALFSAIFSVAVPVHSQSVNVTVGKFFWINPPGRDRLCDLLQAEPREGAFRPCQELHGRDRFQIIQISEKWARIRFDDLSEAWIYTGILGNRELILPEDPKVTEQRNRAAEKRRMEERRQQAEAARISQINAQPWSQKTKDLVRAGRIEKGMEPNMVKLALGHPERIIETDIGSTKQERWIYTGGTILYFENDRLIGWQRVR
jgi:hypothetical protein